MNELVQTIATVGADRIAAFIAVNYVKPCVLLKQLQLSPLKELTVVEKLQGMILI